MMKETMECEATEVRTGAVARLKSTLLSQERLQNLSTLFKIFSDPIRLRILSALLQEELCVCGLSELLEMAHSAVSHQLSVLRQNHLIRYRRNGKNIYHFLDGKHIQFISDVGLSHIMEGWYTVEKILLQRGTAYDLQNSVSLQDSVAVSQADQLWRTLYNASNECYESHVISLGLKEAATAGTYFRYRLWKQEHAEANVEKGLLQCLWDGNW